MSSSADRDSTTFRFSTASNSPATNVQSALPNSSCAMIATNVTVRVPATRRREPPPERRHAEDLLAHADRPLAERRMDPRADVPLVFPPVALVVAVDPAHLVGTADEDAPGLRVVVLVEEELGRTREVREAERPAIAVTARIAITGRFNRCSSRGHRVRLQATGPTGRDAMDPKRIVQEGYDRARRVRSGTANSASDETRSWFLDEILQRLPAGADVLELGCGWGSVRGDPRRRARVHGGRPVSRAARDRPRAPAGDDVRPGRPHAARASRRRRSTRSSRSTSSTTSRGPSRRRRSSGSSGGCVPAGASWPRSAPATRTTRSKKTGSASRCSSRASSRT